MVRASGVPAGRCERGVRHGRGAERLSPERGGGSNPPQSNTADHYAVQVTNMPPTEIICKCGQRFVGDDVIAKQKDHMDKENR